MKKQSMEQLFSDLGLGLLPEQDRADLEGTFFATSPGQTLQQAYTALVVASRPMQESEGVFAVQAVPLEAPEPGEDVREWQRAKLDLAPGRAIAFGYKLPPSKSPEWAGKTMWRIFGRTMPHAAAAKD